MPLTRLGVGGAPGAAWANSVYANYGEAGDDTVAPTLTGQTGAAGGTTVATGRVSTNEGTGTLYWVVTESATSPSVAQVQAGQDDGGSAAADSGSQSVTETGEQVALATGLTAATTYYFHFQQEDAATNDSTVVTSSSFDTLAAGSGGGYHRRVASRSPRLFR